MTEQSAPVRDFTGLNERASYGKSGQETSSLDNVLVANGMVKGRRGLTLWDAISTAATNQIIGLWDFYAPAAGTSKLVRMQTTKFEEWDDAGDTWTDRTGTALNGTTASRPSFANLSDEGFMVFTNEGADRPRKWTGSGNTAVLSGTPPYAKALCAYKGFLFLLNTSTDGTFGATADSITAYFSDTPDVSWDPCDNNIMIFDESAGALRWAEVFGDDMIVFKDDCIVNTRFGGITRFARKRLDFAQGLLAPLSVKKCGEFGVIFLATDLNLYITDGRSVKPLPLNVQESLRAMSKSLAPYVSACVDTTTETYHLLYSRSSTTYYDGRISYNYRTGEFSKAQYSGYELTRLHSFKTASTAASRIVTAANDKKVYEMEVGIDDAGTAINRYFDMDWTQFGNPGLKWFNGVECTFTRAAATRVRISVAVDKSSKFRYLKTFSLAGRPNEDETRVSYKLQSSICGSWFKVRFEFLHDHATTDAQLIQYEPIIVGINGVSNDTPRSAQPQSF
jgi:hypothetical protein